MVEPSEQDRRQVLDEQLLSELKMIRENTKDLPEVLPELRQDVRTLKADMAEVKADIRMIKKAVSGHSRTLARHKEQIEQLEAR